MDIIIGQVGGEGRWRHERIKQATAFLAHRLMSKKRCSELTIFIDLAAGTSTFGDYNTRGDVAPCGIRKMGELPKSFNIRLRRDDPWSWTVEYLAHEMVHVMQFSSGKLQSKHDLSSWEGGEWFDSEKMEYRERPWEMEAFSKQEALRDEFFTVEQTNWVH